MFWYRTHDLHCFARARNGNLGVRGKVSCVLGRILALRYFYYANTGYTDRIFASILCVCLEAKQFTSLRLLQVRKGFNSNLGLEREAQNNFPVIRQPRYRPDLQPLDYSLWNAIDDLMAEEERTWPKGFHEEYVDFRARLKQKAFSLDAPTVNDAMASMKRRCVQLDRTGGQWTEKD